MESPNVKATDMSAIRSILNSLFDERDIRGAIQQRIDDINTIIKMIEEPGSAS